MPEPSLLSVVSGTALPCSLRLVGSIQEFAFISSGLIVAKRSLAVTPIHLFLIHKLSAEIPPGRPPGLRSNFSRSVLPFFLSSMASSTLAVTQCGPLSGLTIEEFDHSYYEYYGGLCSGKSVEVTT